MAIDIWFRDDVTRILAAARVALDRITEAHGAAQPEHADAYRAGFEDGLATVAAAFGVSLPQRNYTANTPMPPVDIYYPRLPDPFA